MFEQSFLENQTLILFMLICSVFRIYLEIIKFDFKKMPLHQKVSTKAAGMHKLGFYFSVGFFVLFAPSFIFS